ncbi:unnamed protein product [Rotaria sp. Silwood2]|nr:unnamed protein product [Rotaria sp. Silwood2]
MQKNPLIELSNMFIELPLCNGRIDYIDEGLDEAYCFDTEIHVCKDNEYRCHNGLCTSEEFWENDFGDANYLDRSDEFADVLYPNNCYRDPICRCEEHLCRTNRFDFSCGDRQCVQTFDKCHNRHHVLLIQSLSNQSYLSNNCLIGMMYLTQLIKAIHGILSETLFSNNLINDFIKNCDSIFQFPINSIYMNHIHLLYGWVWSYEICDGTFPRQTSN